MANVHPGHHARAGGAAPKAWGRGQATLVVLPVVVPGGSSGKEWVVGSLCRPILDGFSHKDTLQSP